MVETQVSISIMAHPVRKEWALELSRELDAPISWDQGGVEWNTGARAWEMFNPSASWHLVVQDDALICRDLRSRLSEALSGLEHKGPVSLYLGTGKPASKQPIVREAVALANGPWIELPWLLWGVAIVLPTKHIRRMLHSTNKHHSPYDQRISRWYERQGISTLYTWPSLVDHRDDESLLDHGGVERRAYKWIGRTGGRDYARTDA